ncbi:MAG: hypothetical protein IJJ33_12510 [Victivallales bacterium]|nr:hypothetical protein [Victivallales bacterium]
MMRNFRSAIYLLPALVCLMASCYHLGTPGNLKKISVGAVENQTEEPAAAAALNQCLREQLGIRPGLRNRSEEHAEYLLAVKVADFRSQGIARAKIRNRNDRDHKEDAYQSVLQRIEMTVNYTVSKANDDTGEPVFSGKVIGRGDVPRMHDRNLTLQDAIRQAANDAARQITDALADQTWGK